MNFFKHIIMIIIIIIISGSPVWCPGQNKRISPLFPPWMWLKATKGLTALTPEIDCDQAAMDLPPVTSAVFLVAE
jgi:hypothetical protein